MSMSSDALLSSDELSMSSDASLSSDESRSRRAVVGRRCRTRRSTSFLSVVNRQTKEDQSHDNKQCLIGQYNSTTDLAFYSTSLDFLPFSPTDRRGGKFGVHKIFHLLLVVSSFRRSVTISRSFCFRGLYRTLVGSILGLYDCILSKTTLQCWLCVGDETRRLFFFSSFFFQTSSSRERFRTKFNQ